MAAKVLGRAVVAVMAVMSVGCGGLAGQRAGAAAPRASISGTVRDAVTGQPIGGASVSIFALRPNGLPDGTVVYGPTFLVGAVTAAAGTYRISVPASDANGYWVCFDTGLFGPYEFQCWADQSTFFYPLPDPLGFSQLPTGSKTVSVAAGEGITGIDADLIHPVAPGSPSPTGAVSGQVTVAGAKSGVSGAVVTAFNAEALPVGHTVTALHGAYRLDNLAPGTDAICVDPSDGAVATSPTALHGRCFVSARWRTGSPPPLDASPVSVTIGSTASHVNVALLPGGSDRT
jgi:hypothetical protein